MHFVTFIIEKSGGIMSSNYESFFDGESYAVVGNSSRRNYPELTFNALVSAGKKVFPIDPELKEVNGALTFRSIDETPEPVEGIVLEVPREETVQWIDKAIEAGIKNVWIHQGCDSPEAAAKAKEAGINLRRGTCAVMYLTQGFSIHGFHRGIMKILGKF